MYKLAPLTTALLTLGSLAQAQTVDFELHTYPDSPIVFASESARAAASGVPHRQFVTIRNQSKKSVSGVIFQQTVSGGSKAEIVAIEHVGIVMAAGEKKRVTISVEDVRKKIPPGRPVLSVVAVEFLDGTLWNAPSGSGAAAALE